MTVDELSATLPPKSQVYRRASGPWVVRVPHAEPTRPQYGFMDYAVGEHWRLLEAVTEARHAGGWTDKSPAGG